MSETRGKRGPYQKSLVRKQKIAESVLGIVDSDGFEAVTTAGVAEATGIREASVHYHFPTKDHLLVAAMRRADAQTYDENEMGQGSAWLDFDELRRSLDSGGGVHVGRARLETVLRSLATKPEHPAAEFIAERNRRAVDVWAAMVVRRQEAGLADPRLDPVAVAWQIIAVLEGFARFSIAEPEAWASHGLELGDLVVDALRRLTMLPGAFSDG